MKKGPGDTLDINMHAGYPSAGIDADQEAKGPASNGFFKNAAMMRGLPLRQLGNVNGSKRLNYWLGFLFPGPVQGIRGVLATWASAPRIPWGESWLSVCFQSQFKVLLLVFKALEDSGPNYPRGRCLP